MSSTNKEDLIVQEDTIKELTKEEKDKLTEENFRLVGYIAKKFMNTNIPYDELFSQASVGFVKALNNFDKSKKINGEPVKFSTYAISCMTNDILYFYRKERKFSQNNISINTILSEDKNGNSFNLEQILYSNQLERDNSLEDSILKKEDMNILMGLLDELSEKEKYIITYRFGLDRGIKKTQKEIAEKVGMSQANISKLEKSIIKKCKKILKDKEKKFDNYKKLIN